MTIVTRASKGAALTHAEMDANLTGLADMSLITYTPAGSNVEARNLQTKVRESVISVTDYDTLDDALTAAANRTLFFPAGAYTQTSTKSFPSNVALYFENGASLTGSANITMTFNAPVKSDNTFAATFPNAVLKTTAGSPKVVMPSTSVCSFADQLWIGDDFTIIASSQSPSDSALRDDLNGAGVYFPGGAGRWDLICGGVGVMQFHPSGVNGTPGVVAVGDGDVIVTGAPFSSMVFHYNRGVRNENNARTTTYNTISAGSLGNTTHAVQIGGGDSQGSAGPGPVMVGAPTTLGLTNAAVDDLVLRNAKALRGIKNDGSDCVRMVELNASDRVLLGGGGANQQFGDALVALGGGAAPTLGTIGGSGPATAGQNSWKQFYDSAGNAFWVPVWK